MTPRFEERLDRLAELISAAPHNLVARRDRADVRRRHVDEALAVVGLLPLRPGARWMDLGTGGGLPGLVCALAAPEVQWVLVDSVAKKAAAVREFGRALSLTNVQVVEARAETLARDPAHRMAYDGVVSRALAPMPVLVELCRGFLRPGGHLAAIKGPRVDEELAGGAGALARLGLTAVQRRDVAGTVRPTRLVTMRASGPVPLDVPRGVGVPKRTPLWEG